MAGKIFISYRRDDVPGDARGIRDALTRQFGKLRVFMDVDDVLAGQRFDQELERALAQCDVLIAVIGPRWMGLLKTKEQSGERDFVHDEIASALERGIVVIPVRVGREERMPPLPRAGDLPTNIRDLVLYQKHDVTHETFGRDVDKLITAIRMLRKSQRRRFVERIHSASARFASLGRTLAPNGTWRQSAWTRIAGPHANLAANPFSQFLVTPTWWIASLYMLILLVLMAIPNLAWRAFSAYPSGVVLRPAELPVLASAFSVILNWLVVLACVRLFGASRSVSMLLAGAFVVGSMVAVPNSYLVWLITAPGGNGKEAGAFSSFELSIPFGLAGIIVFLWASGRTSLRPLIFIGLFEALVVLRYYLFNVFGVGGVAHPLFLVGLLAYPYVRGFSLLRYAFASAMGVALWVAWFHFGAMPMTKFPEFMSNGMLLLGVYVLPIFTVWIALRAAATKPSPVPVTNWATTLSRLAMIAIVSLAVLASAARMLDKYLVPLADESVSESDPSPDTSKDGSKSGQMQTPQRPARP